MYLTSISIVWFTWSPICHLDARKGLNLSVWRDLNNFYVLPSSNDSSIHPPPVVTIVSMIQIIRDISSNPHVSLDSIPLVGQVSVDLGQVQVFYNCLGHCQCCSIVQQFAFLSCFKPSVCFLKISQILTHFQINTWR